MSNQRARVIVDKLLEYGMEPGAPRPGSPDDPWRQSSGPLKFKRGDFEGVRSGQPPVTHIPDEDFLNPEDLMDEPPIEPPAGPPGPPPPKPGPGRDIQSRFKWRPPPPAGP